MDTSPVVRPSARAWPRLDERGSRGAWVQAVLLGLALVAGLCPVSAASPDVNQAPALLLQGLKLQRAGRLSEAEAKWRKALEADPDNSFARSYLKALGRSVTNGISHWLDGNSRRLPARPAPAPPVVEESGSQTEPTARQSFSVDPEKLMQGLSNELVRLGAWTPQAAAAAGSRTDNLALMIRAYFRAAGLAWEEAMTYEESRRRLSIQARPRDLQMIEQALRAIDALVTPEPQSVQLEVKILEMTEGTARRLNLYGSLEAGSGGTTRDTVPSVAADVSASTLSGALKAPLFKLMLKTLSQEAGVNVTNLPRFAARSGEQAQAKAVRVRQFLVGPNLGCQEPFELGSLADVLPLLDETEGGTRLTVMVTRKEFLDCDPGLAADWRQRPNHEESRRPDGGVESAGPVMCAIHPPIFKLGQVMGSATLHAGESLFLCGGRVAVSRLKAGTTVSEPLPSTGEATAALRTILLVFVTPNWDGMEEDMWRGY